jgi:hypothetical protein
VPRVLLTRLSISRFAFLSIQATALEIMCSGYTSADNGGQSVLIQGKDNVTATGIAELVRLGGSCRRGVASTMRGTEVIVFCVSEATFVRSTAYQ